MASRFAHILDFVNAELKHREAAAGDALTPSKYWLDYNQYSAYIRSLPDEELDYIRRHTWHLTGDNYASYLSMTDRMRRKNIAQHAATLPRLDGFLPQEPPRGIGMDSPYGKISSGIMRYSVALADLYSSGHLARKGPRRMLEIGGGYGGLALLCLQFNPEVSYLICDLEESLFVQGVFLSQHLGEDRVKLVRGENGDVAALQPGHVYLLPQWRAKVLEGMRFDIAINQQSMQEMTLAQVERYCEILAQCADRFYSSNRRSHGSHIVRDKGLIATLHQTLAGRFSVVWDSTDHEPLLARLGLRYKVVRKLLTAFGGERFVPTGEAGLRRFIYQCRAQ